MNHFEVYAVHFKMTNFMVSNLTTVLANKDIIQNKLINLTNNFLIEA